MSVNVLVLLSTYNGEKYLREQLDSVIRQKDVNVKLLIRDDGSCDNTLNIIEEYLERNPDIVYLKGKNVGACQSFLELFFSENYSFEYDYIAFCDQDDIWKENKLINAINKLGESKNPKLYYSALDFKDGEKIHTKCNRFEANFFEALVRSQFPGCTMVLNKVAVDFIRNFKKPQNAIMHDWFIYQVMSGAGFEIFYDKNSYILYRIHGNNVSVKSKNPIKRIRKSFKFFNERKGERLRAAIELRDNYLHLLNDDAAYALKIITNYQKSLKGKKEVINLLLKTRYSVKIKLFFGFSFVFNIY